MADCLDSYTKQWPIMMTVCEENRTEIDSNVSNIVHNLGVKRSAEELLQRLKPIAVALDAVQRDNCGIADAVEIWKRLETDLALQNRESKKAFQKRLDQALTPSHLLANVIHPRYRGKSLTQSEYDTAMECASTQYSEMFPDLITFRTEASPFQSFMFKDTVVQTVAPLDWWKSQADRLNPQTNAVAVQLLTAVASSAGVERVFSSFGLVHSNIRNRLGIEKAGKLFFLFKLLNNNAAKFDTEET